MPGQADALVYPRKQVLTGYVEWSELVTWRYFHAAQALAGCYAWREIRCAASVPVILKRKRIS